MLWGDRDSPFLVYKTKVMNILPKHFESFIILFSRIPASGIRTKIMRKYRIEANWPIIIYGCSTGCPPIHVRVNRSATRIQNRHWLIGRNIKLRWADVWSRGRRIRIKMERIRASTPPSLFGMERRIA